MPWLIITYTMNTGKSQTVWSSKYLRQIKSTVKNNSYNVIVQGEMHKKLGYCRGKSLPRTITIQMLSKNIFSRYYTLIKNRNITSDLIVRMSLVIDTITDLMLEKILVKH